MKPHKTSKLIMADSDATDAVRLIKLTAKQHKGSAAVARLLELHPYQSTNDYAWLKGVFMSISGLTRYVNDEPGMEQIKTPDRFLLKDGFGDCDDYSTLWAALLEKLNKVYYIKIVKYARSGEWAHVYIVVPMKNGKQLVLDNVLHKMAAGQFGQEVKYVDFKLF